MDEPYLTVRQVAQRLQVSELTIRRWIVAGRIQRAAKITNRSGWRVPASEVDRLLQLPPRTE